MKWEVFAEYVLADRTERGWQFIHQGPTKTRFTVESIRIVVEGWGSVPDLLRSPVEVINLTSRDGLAVMSPNVMGPLEVFIDREVHLLPCLMSHGDKVIVKSSRELNDIWSKCFMRVLKEVPIG